MSSPAAPRSTWPQRLLGAFILWQLLFLLAGNAAPLLPEPARDRVGAVPNAWATLTGQWQEWSLFAPLVPDRALFVAVEGWSPGMEKPVRLPSSFEPNDDGRYCRPPGSGDRLFHQEKQLAWPMLVFTSQQDIAAKAKEWHDYLADQVRPRWREYRTYLAWRRREYQRANPDAPTPREWTLLVRIYPVSAAGTAPARQEIIEMPFVRWRPDVEPPPGCLPLELYDFGVWRWLPEQGADR